MLIETSYDRNHNFDFFRRLVFQNERPKIVKYASRLIERLAAIRTDNERILLLRQETLRYCTNTIPAYRGLKNTGNWDNLPILSKPIFWKNSSDFCNPGFPYDLFITTSGTVSGGGKFVQRSDLEFFLWDHYLNKVSTGTKRVLAVRLLDHFHGLRIIERSGGHETRIQFPFKLISHVKTLVEFLIHDRKIDSYDEIVFRGSPEYSRSLICYLQENNLKYKKKAKFVIEIGRKISRYWRSRLKQVCGATAEIREIYGISEFPMSSSPVAGDGGARMPINVFPELADMEGNIIKEPFIKGQFLFSHIVPFTLRQPLLRYATGDYGYFDENGRIFFQGRLSRIIYEKGLKSFGWMDVKKALDGAPGLYYHAEAFPMFSNGIIHDRSAIPPHIDFQNEDGKTIIVIFLTTAPAPKKKDVQARVEQDIDQEIIQKGLDPQEVRRHMRIIFKSGESAFRLSACR